MMAAAGTPLGEFFDRAVSELMAAFTAAPQAAAAVPLAPLLTAPITASLTASFTSSFPPIAAQPLTPATAAPDLI